MDTFHLTRTVLELFIYQLIVVSARPVTDDKRWSLQYVAVLTGIKRSITNSDETARSWKKNALNQY